MKLISLNTWGGKLYEPLMEFIKSEAQTTDIFCFQEIYFSEMLHPEVPWIRANLAFELKNLLSNFLMFERLAVTQPRQNAKLDKDIKIGEIIFIKKPADIIEDGGFHTYSEDGESAKEKIEISSGNFQFVKFKNAEEPYFIGNIHGLWLPGTKSDTPKRIEQTRQIQNHIENFPNKKIVCGDFNLHPETQSIKMLSVNMRNLIKEYKVTTTRNRFYSDMEKYADYIADYIFVSPNIEVNDFRVLPDEVSDHSPLLLEFF